MIRKKVRLSCGHTKFVQMPADLDLKTKLASSACPQGCGEHLIIEVIEGEN